MSGPKNDSVYRLNKTEPVKATRTSRKFQVTQYSKLVVPVSMRSIYWQYFGFPANNDGEIISKTRIVCVICRGQIAYNRNTSNLRMHLQNKHLEELNAIESQATPKTCKTKLIRREVATDEEQFMSTNDESIREYYPAGDINLEEMETVTETMYFEETVPASKKRISRPVDIDSHLLRTITTFMILDLERPEVVLGKGFHRLLLNIENPASVPNVPVVTDEILPRKYQQTKNKLKKELNMVTGSVGLTLEEWQCMEGRWYVSVCIYYQSDGDILCKMLSTFAFLPEMDVQMWECIIQGLLEEWGISCDRISAAVCSMERDAMVDALENFSIPVVPCLDSAIKECVRQCFSDEVIKEIINKVRRQMLLFKNCPAVWNHASEVSKQQLLPPIVLDVEAVWLTTLEMLEVALKWRKASKKIVDQMTDPNIEPLLEIYDSEWEIVSDLIDALQPLKMTLMSISEEKVPFLSLVRPMLWQVIENKLNSVSDQSEVSANLKKAIIGILNFRYTPEKVANVLNVATVVDPRFKVLSDYEEDEKQKIGQLVHNAIKDVVIHNPDEEKESVQNRRLSNISMLLGELKRKKVKEDAEESANWEYQTYLTQENLGLENDPVQWWVKNNEKYPRIANLAEKYFCVPAVTTLPGKRTAESFINFHIKRSTLSPDIINELLFLHVNYRGP